MGVILLGGGLMITGKKIGMVILNYNDSQTVKEYYHLIKEYHSIDHIVIVDNKSPDGSFEKLKPLAGGNIEVIQTNQNKGYSYGNDFGIKYLMEHYHVDILFISNPDVEYPESFLEKIVQDMIDHKAKAATGYMHAPCEAIMNRRINTYWREVLDCTCILRRIFPFRGKLVKPGQGIIQTEWVPGSLFAIDAAAYQEVHGFDENVFLYYEEQILGKKFIDAGYKMIVDTDIEYKHNVSVSIDKAMKKVSKLKQLYKSKYYFYTHYEHIGLAKKILMQIATRYSVLRIRIKIKLIG